MPLLLTANSLHHLMYPHMGLCELLRTAREGVIFIEAKDTILHGIRRTLGFRRGDYEPSGNYVYRWKGREIEKISLSAHAHSYAIKTSFLPLSVYMRRMKGAKLRIGLFAHKLLNKILWWSGNVMIVLIFKKAPTEEQVQSLLSQGFSYKVNRAPTI